MQTLYTMLGKNLRRKVLFFLGYKGKKMAANVYPKWTVPFHKTQTSFFVVVLFPHKLPQNPIFYQLLVRRIGLKGTALKLVFILPFNNPKVYPLKCLNISTFSLSNSQILKVKLKIGLFFL